MWYVIDHAFQIDDIDETAATDGLSRDRPFLNERRSIGADTALRLGRYFGRRPPFWLDL
jgi:plasmid maintenance system antidote protein VapI